MGMFLLPTEPRPGTLLNQRYRLELQQIWLVGLQAKFRIKQALAPLRLLQTEPLVRY
jgi:hypothetical protein